MDTNIFPMKYVIWLVVICVAVAFAANGFHDMTTDLNDYAASHSDDIFSGKLGKRLLS